jgi:hypothetical protein
VAALTAAELASWLVSWWFAPVDAVNLNRLDPGVFTERGIVAIGYAGFAFALGVAAGALTRRTLPAIATTLLGFTAARIAFTLWTRPHLLASRHVLISVTLGKGIGVGSSPSGVSILPNTPTIPNAWAITDALVNRAHDVLTAGQLHDLLLRTCPAIVAGSQQNSASPPKSPGAPDRRHGLRHRAARRAHARGRSAGGRTRDPSRLQGLAEGERRVRTSDGPGRGRHMTPPAAHEAQPRGVSSLTDSPPWSQWKPVTHCPLPPHARVVRVAEARQPPDKEARCTRTGSLQNRCTPAATPAAVGVAAVARRRAGDGLPDRRVRIRHHQRHASGRVRRDRVGETARRPG